MPDIKAFEGYYYDCKIAGKLEDVTAPPYDIITPSQREEFYRKSPFNIIRIILGKEEVSDDEISNKYSRAAEYLENWLNEGILKKDVCPSLYLLEQEFTYNSKRYLRFGFLALFELTDFKEGKIFPHENTLSGPKIDRMNLLEATRANFSPIFSFYIDKKNTVENIFATFKKQPPFLFVIGSDGVKNNLWKLTDKNQIDKISDVMKNKQIFIADGHHRYETALNYKRLHPSKNPNDGANFILMYFSNTEQPGMLILPTYRVVKKSNISGVSEFKAKIKDFFDEQDAADLETTLRLVNAQDDTKRFGVFMADKFFVLTLDKRKCREIFDIFSAPSNSKSCKELDVRTLDELLIKRILNAGGEENINFVKEAGEAVELVKKGLYEIAFFLKAASLSEIKEVALAGERMPKKSTYFHPKLLSGLIINKF